MAEAAKIIDKTEAEDAIDALWARGRPELLGEPDVYRSISGGPIYGHPPKELARAVARMCLELDTLDFTAATDRLPEINRTLKIETAALLILQSVFSKRVLEHAARRRPDVERWSMTEIEVTLLSEFSGLDMEVIRDRMARCGEIYGAHWAAVAPDEEAVTPEQVDEFYKTLPFPCSVIAAGESHLGLAIRAAPAMVASMIGARKAFDFGGNCGFVTAAFRAAGLEQSVLFDPNSEVLEFARFRDEIAGLDRIDYVSAIDHDALRRDYAGAFDIGVCTEVLEHLYDVEETVETVATMLKPGGAAMISASFLLEEPSHLHKNRVFGGQEHALMAKYGLQRVAVDLGFPLLSNMHFYKKV